MLRHPQCFALGMIITPVNCSWQIILIFFLANYIMGVLGTRESRGGVYLRAILSVSAGFLARGGATLA